MKLAKGESWPGEPVALILQLLPLLNRTRAKAVPKWVPGVYDLVSLVRSSIGACLQDSEAKFNGFMVAVTVAVAVAYAWLAATLLEPRPVAPPTVVAGVVWIERGVMKHWEEIFASQPVTSAKISKILSQFDKIGPLIGNFRKPPLLVINRDREFRYQVGPDRIELSELIAVTEGQLARALFKSWLMQSAAPEFSESLLRLDVISDVLTMATFGEFLPLPPPGNWLNHVTSHASACESPWRSLELPRKCGQSESIDPLGFRPLLSGIILSAYRDVPAMQKFNLIRDWARVLRRGVSFVDADAHENPRKLTEWRDWLLRELSVIAPAEAFGARLDAAVSVARLGSSQPPEVEAVFHADDLRVDIRGKTSQASRASYIMSLPGDENWLVSNRDAKSWIRLGDEISDVRAALLVWQGCGPVTIGQIMSYPIESERVLFIGGCEKYAAGGWWTLLHQGLEGFARGFPETAFILLKRSEVERAIRHGQFALDQPVERYMNKTAPSPLLGLASAKWHQSSRAYRVLGAIEAIEWFRSPGSDQPSL